MLAAAAPAPPLELPRCILIPRFAPTQHDVKGQTAGRQAGALLHLLARAHHPRRHRHGSCRPARLPSASCDLPRSRPTCPHAARTGTTHRQRVTQRSFATPAYGPPGSLPPMLTCVPCARRALAADLHVQRVAARRRDRDADRHGVPSSSRSLARSSSALSPLFKLGSDRFYRSAHAPAAARSPSSPASTERAARGCERGELLAVRWRAHARDG